MDDRLEPVGKLLANTEGLEYDAERELAFALELTDPEMPEALYWLAACAIARALELERGL